MSADNGHIIRINNKGEYVLQMYFASNDSYPDVNDPRARTFPTLDAACRYQEHDVISGNWTEYGLTIDLSNEKKESKMEIEKFVRRSFAVKGVQVTVENINEVAAWAEGAVVSDPLDNPIFIKINVKHALNERQTQAHVGDWVLSTKKGYKVYTDRAFKANFRAHDEVVHAVTQNVTNFYAPAGAKKEDYVLVNGHNPKGV